MFKNIFVTTNFLILLFFVNATSAQINVKLAKKNYTISNFNTDTLTSKALYIKEDSLLLSNRYIQCIKSSKYELEVRCFYKYNSLNNGFIMIILRGNERRLWIEEYYLSEVYVVTDNTPSIKVDDGTVIAIQVRNYHVSHPDLVLTQLIRYGLFNSDEMYREHEKFYRAEDASNKVIFEVKLNNNYRSFSYGIRNKPHSIELEAISDGKEIFNIINQLTNKK